MKKIVIFLFCLLLAGCAAKPQTADIAATTLPVYTFTNRLCEGTPLSVTRLITEQVSCLHDYSLSVSQVKTVEGAKVVVTSGAGLEDFMSDLLSRTPTIDASDGIQLRCTVEEHEEEKAHEEDHHHHDEDPHIWLSPTLAEQMAENICDGLCEQFTEYTPLFRANLSSLLDELDKLEQYGQDQLSALRCHEMITFHDGFFYFADEFGLSIIEAVEEESGSEASAKDLIRMIHIVEDHKLPAIYTERSGSVSAAGIISRETGCASYALDMAIAGDDYFEAMYHNIDVIKEALR